MAEKKRKTMDLSVFERLAKRFRQCQAEIKRGKKTSYLMERVMEAAGKAFYEAISSKAIDFENIPPWFEEEPKGNAEFYDSQENMKIMDVYYWDLYWWFVVDWLAENQRGIGIVRPAGIGIYTPERYLKKYHFSIFLSRVCGIRSQGSKATFYDVAKASEDVCSYLAAETKPDDNVPETVEINMVLFSESPSNKLLTKLILTPMGVEGTSEEAKNLRAVLCDNKPNEYKKVAEHIHKRENETIICVDTKKITLKAKKIPT